MIGHFDINVDVANGLDPLGLGTPNNAYLNTGYLTWAGITAGKAQSFYLVRRRRRQLGELRLPRPKGFNEPDLLAYTASFGGGFTATIAARKQARMREAAPRAAARLLAARITDQYRGQQAARSTRR